MNLVEFKRALKETGIKVVYRKFEEMDTPTFPCIVYYVSDENEMWADNMPLFSTKLISIELYTDKKDTETEDILRTVMAKHDVFLDFVDEIYWPDDELYEVLYQVTIH